MTVLTHEAKEGDHTIGITEGGTTALARQGTAEHEYHGEKHHDE